MNTYNILKYRIEIFNPFIPAEQCRLSLQTVQIEMRANYESSHQDLHCLPFDPIFLADIPICNNGCVQIQRWKSPVQKLRVERVNILNIWEHGIAC